MNNPTRVIRRKVRFQSFRNLLKNYCLKNQSLKEFNKPVYRFYAKLRPTNMTFLFLSVLFSFVCLNRLFEVQSEDARKMSGFLARRKAITILDSSHSQNAVVLLVCYCPGILQHCHRRSWTLRSTRLFDGVFAWVFKVLIRKHALNVFFWCFRCNWVPISGSVYVRNVHQNVCTWTSHLLWVVFQPVWLRRYQWIDLRSHLVRTKRRLVRLVSAACIAPSENL